MCTVVLNQMRGLANIYEGGEMYSVYCEQCGGRNSVPNEQIKANAAYSVTCSICGHLMGAESLSARDGGFADNVVDSSQYHLLFIDDDKFYIKLAQSILGKDYKVSVASSGGEGLRLAEELQPDIILLDVLMPDADGYAICEELKKNPATRHIAVFFVTAASEGEDVHRGFQVGAVDYVCKPLQLDLLNARIALQLRLKQLVKSSKSSMT